MSRCHVSLEPWHSGMDLYGLVRKRRTGAAVLFRIDRRGTAKDTKKKVVDDHIVSRYGAPCTFLNLPPQARSSRSIVSILVCSRDFTFRTSKDPV